MPFTIPDQANAPLSTLQSDLYSTTVGMIQLGIQGYAVQQGCAVSQHAAGANMSVDVAAGISLNGGKPVTVAAQNVAVTSNTSGSPRLDIVSVNLSGTVVVTAGTAAAAPTEPALPAGNVPLAQVFVPASAASITTANITDRRVFNSSLPFINVRDAAYGALGDGVTDDTTAIQAALNASTGQAIFLPSGNYKITAPLTVPNAIQYSFKLLGAGMVNTKITSTHAGPVLTMDPNATPQTSTRRQYWHIESMWITGPGSGTAGSVGLNLNNCGNGSLNDVYINNYETGVKLDALDLANGAFCYYNAFFNLIIQNCVTGCKILTQANSNTFYGGSISSNTVGMYIVEPTTVGTNNIAVIGMDFESNATSGVDCNGYQCHFLGCRFEAGTGTWDIRFRTAAGSGSNTAITGTRNTVISYFNSHPATGGKYQDNSATKDNVVQVSGWLTLGDQSSNTPIDVMTLTRSVASTAKAMIFASDTYVNDSTHKPVGFRYRSKGFHKGGILLEYDDGSVVREMMREEINNSSGDTELWFGNYAVTTADSYISRDGAAAALKTVGTWRAGSATNNLLTDANGHLVSTGTTPSKTNGTGAGTSPTTSVTGTDVAGVISVLTGTAPAGSNAAIITVTFANAFAATPKAVILTPANAAAAALSGATQVFEDQANRTASAFIVKAGSTALATATTYLWSYTVLA